MARVRQQGGGRPRRAGSASGRPPARRPWSAAAGGLLGDGGSRPAPRSGRGPRPGRGRPRRRRRRRRARWKGSNIRRRGPRAATPGPWSTMRNVAPRSRSGLPVDLDRRRRCAGGRCRRRLASTRSSRPASHRTRREVGRDPDARRVVGSLGQRGADDLARADGRSAAGSTAPVWSRLMSSRSATIAVSRAADGLDGLEQRRHGRLGPAASSWRRRVLERPRSRPASGVRRSWETAASSAVRVRLPASSSRAAAVCRASSSRSHEHAEVGGEGGQHALARRVRASAPRSTRTRRAGTRRRPPSPGARAAVPRDAARPPRPGRSRRTSVQQPRDVVLAARATVRLSTARASASARAAVAWAWRRAAETTTEATAGGHEREGHQREHVEAAGHVEGVHRLGEPEVERQHAEHGGAQRRPSAAHEGAADGEREEEHRLERRPGTAVEGQQEARSARPYLPPRAASHRAPTPVSDGALRGDGILTPAIIRHARGAAASRSGSARRSTSRVTGATSPAPDIRNRSRCHAGLPSVHSK